MVLHHLHFCRRCIRDRFCCLLLLFCIHSRLLFVFTWVRLVFCSFCLWAVDSSFSDWMSCRRHFWGRLAIWVVAFSWTCWMFQSGSRREGICWHCRGCTVFQGWGQIISDVFSLRNQVQWWYQHTVSTDRSEVVLFYQRRRYQNFHFSMLSYLCSVIYHRLQLRCDWVDIRIQARCRVEIWVSYFWVLFFCFRWRCYFWWSWWWIPSFRWIFRRIAWTWGNLCSRGWRGGCSGWLRCFCGSCASWLWEGFRGGCREEIPGVLA